MKAGSQKNEERCGQQRRTAGEDVPSLTTRLRSLCIVAEEEKEKQIIRARRPFSTDQMGGFLCELCGSLASFAVKGFDLSQGRSKTLRPQRSPRKDAKSAE